MSTEELRAHIQQLREVSSSSITLKKLISDKPTKEPKETTEKKTKDLASKYLNM
jgi:hypothetical protein